MNIYLVGSPLKLYTHTPAYYKLEGHMMSPKDLRGDALRKFFEALDVKKLKAFSNLKSASKWASNHDESETKTTHVAIAFFHFNSWELIRRPIYQVRVSEKRTGFCILAVQRVFINSISTPYDVLNLKKFTKKRILGKYVPRPLHGINQLTRTQWLKVRLTILCIKRYLPDHPIAKISKDIIKMIFKLAKPEISSNHWNCYQGSVRKRIESTVSQWSSVEYI